MSSNKPEQIRFDENSYYSGENQSQPQGLSLEIKVAMMDHYVHLVPAEKIREKDKWEVGLNFTLNFGTAMMVTAITAPTMIAVWIAAGFAYACAGYCFLNVRNIKREMFDGKKKHFIIRNGRFVQEELTSD